MADTLRATIGTAKLRQHFNSADVIEAIMRGQRSPEIGAGFAQAARRLIAGRVRLDEGQVGFAAHKKTVPFSARKNLANENLNISGRTAAGCCAVEFQKKVQSSPMPRSFRSRVMPPCFHWIF